MIFVSLVDGLHCHKLGRCIWSLIHSPAALHTESVVIWSLSQRTCLHLQLQQTLGDPADCILGSCTVHVGRVRFVYPGKRDLATIASGAIVSDHRKYLSSSTSSLSCVAGTSVACSVTPRHRLLCGEACQCPCRFVFPEIPAHHAIIKLAAPKLIIAPNRAESISISMSPSANPHLACVRGFRVCSSGHVGHCAAIPVSSKAIRVFVCVVVSSHH